MRNLPQIILLLILSVGLYAQSPHGKEFTMTCADCHNPKGWKLEAGTYSFRHDKTQFPLTGMHEDVDCKLCHSSLVFSEAKTECVSCHTDMHYQTVGMECERCHTPQSWLVNNINEIHRQSRFPLVGAHMTADCYSCHPSASLLRFEPLGIECYDCHQQDYQTAAAPNHVEGKYSTECIDCHNINAFSWSGAGVNHSFFPLTKGHEISDCQACHTGTDYSNISPDCFSCHETDFNAATNPNHLASDFSTTCAECHTTDPDWKPAKFQNHDAQYFPIYSGKHNQEWDACIDCHTNPNSYTTNSCIICHDHNQADMDDEHDDVGGYVYSDPACYECHPTGEADDNSFNHNASNFPLTGAHITTECLNCHANGYAGTTTICGDCHVDAYNQSTNPNHVAVGISNDCAACHTTAPDWVPATFAVHNDYYLLSGAHVTVAQDCFACHEGNYNNTPNICFGCHADNYNQTANPNHFAIGIDNACETCHTTNPEWKPATFPTHNNYYALIGAHATIATDCFTCHNDNYVITPNTCFGCHAADYNQTTDPPHQTEQFPTDCEVCHTQSAWEPSILNHDATNFPLTGSHTNVECSLCHVNGYGGTSTICSDCHDDDFNQSTNPNHNTLGLSDDCETCHTTNANWQPATFPVHNSFYVLAGAHVAISNDCFVCHNGNYNNTPNTCYGCHESDYNQTNDPPHQSAQFPTDCEICHTQSAWEPSTFEHDGQYFPIYSGEHEGEWDQCNDCHTNSGNYSIFTCLPCHPQSEMDDKHENEPGYQYNSDACLACHPDGEAAAQRIIRQF